MSRLFLLVIHITCISYSYSQDTLKISDVFNKTKSQIESLNNALRESNLKSQKVIDSLTARISTVTSVNEKLAALTLKVQTIEKQAQYRVENDKEQLLKRYEAGKIAISSMRTGAKIINFTQRILDLDQTIERTTNIWSDTTFRNTWNKIEEWGTVVGVVVAASSGLAGDSESDKTSGLAIGIGIFGISKIVGNVLGINQKEFREKMERIDLSVRAYDDLIMRNKQLQLYLISNSEFDNRITKFELEYINAGHDKVPVLMAKLLDLLDDYKLILRQIPDYLDNIKTVSFGYVNNKNKYKELPMRDIFESIVRKCEDVKGQYNVDVKPLLDVSPEIAQAIFGFR